MKTAKLLLFYLLFLGLLVIGLTFGSQWLVATAEPGQRVARTPIIPPRIAESIERRNAPVLPVVERYVPLPPLSTMRESNVALRQPTKEVIRELTKPETMKRKTLPRDIRTATPPVEAPKASTVVTAARTDVPF